MSEQSALNTDREIWRGKSRAEFGDPDRFYADSIHVTADGEGIGLNCGGYVIVKPIREWFALAEAQPSPRAGTPQVAEFPASPEVIKTVVDQSFISSNLDLEFMDDKQLRILVTKLRSALAAATAERTPPQVACIYCGGDYATQPLDVVLSKEQWLLLNPDDGGVLCAACIVKRASELPHVINIAAKIQFASDFDEPNSYVAAEEPEK